MNRGSDVLQLQRTIGNQAVSGVLARAGDYGVQIPAGDTDSDYLRTPAGPQDGADSDYLRTPAGPQGGADSDYSRTPSRPGDQIDPLDFLADALDLFSEPGSGYGKTPNEPGEGSAGEAGDYKTFDTAPREQAEGGAAPTAGGGLGAKGKFKLLATMDPRYEGEHLGPGAAAAAKKDPQRKALFARASAVTKHVEKQLKLRAELDELERSGPAGRKSPRYAELQKELQEAKEAEREGWKWIQAMGLAQDPEVMADWKVEYLTTDEARAPFEVQSAGGQLTWGDPRDLLTTDPMQSYGGGSGWAMFVMSPEGRIYAAEHRIQRFHHSSFLAKEVMTPEGMETVAGSVAAAGEMKATKGVLKAISDKSGHYTPHPVHTVNLLQQLTDLKIPLSGVAIHLRQKSGAIEEYKDGDAAKYLVETKAKYGGGEREPAAEDTKPHSYAKSPGEGQPATTTEQQQPAGGDEPPHTYLKSPEKTPEAQAEGGGGGTVSEGEPPGTTEALSQLEEPTEGEQNKYETIDQAIRGAPQTAGAAATTDGPQAAPVSTAPSPSDAESKEAKEKEEKAKRTLTAAQTGDVASKARGTSKRQLTFVKMKRKHIQLRGDDKYGHWWTEVLLLYKSGSPDESYGWWPQRGLPGGLRGLKGTLFGVPGELNGQTSFGGSALRDPHHGDAGDEEFNPVLTNEKSDWQVINEIRAYAKAYTGSWRWTFGWGQNCHTFQEGLMERIGLMKP
jgi:hypothetical protein